MARKYFGIVILLTVAILAGNAVAQKSNEIAGTIGRTVISDQTVSGGSTIHFGDGLTYGANYAHRFFNVGLLGISVEVPFIIDRTNRLQYNTNVVPASFRSIFVTPAVRVNLFPDTSFSPWVSVGGGLGYFTPSSTLEFNNTPNPGKSQSTGVFQVGGGLDLRIIGNLKLRGEFRDFNSGEPPINLSPKSRYSNLYLGAGLVFSF
jgi:opacity protein-like surface antigen